MEWITRKIIFGIARIYGPGSNFSAGGSTKTLPDFKYENLKSYKNHIEHDFFLSNQFFCAYSMQKAALKPY